MKKFTLGLLVALAAVFSLAASPASATHNGRTCFQMQPYVNYILHPAAHGVSIYEGTVSNGQPTGGSYGAGYPGYFWSKGTKVTYHEWHAHYGWTENIVRWYWQGSPTYPNNKVLYQTTGGGVPVVACYGT